jgi:hypothetical protein
MPDWDAPSVILFNLFSKSGTLTDLGLSLALAVLECTIAAGIKDTSIAMNSDLINLGPIKVLNAV